LGHGLFSGWHAVFFTWHLHFVVMTATVAAANTHGMRHGSHEGLGTARGIAFFLLLNVRNADTTTTAAATTEIVDARVLFLTVTTTTTTTRE